MSFDALEDGSFWGRLNGVSIGTLGDHSKGNCLWQLGKCGWLLRTRHLNANHGLSNLFRCLRIHMLRYHYHILKFSLFERLAGRAADL